MDKARTALQSSLSNKMHKLIDVPGVKIEADHEPEEYVDYYLKKAKLLNGFFQVNRLKEDHEDLQIIAMYLAVQMAMGIISNKDLEEIMKETCTISEALKPRFNGEK